jgi:hypothetical protein
MFLPYIFIKQPIKKLAALSFFIAIIFYLIPLFGLHVNVPFGTHHVYADLNRLLTIDYSISFSTIALLPMAIKATYLLHIHAIRGYDYVKYISMFLLIIVAGVLNELFIAFRTIILILLGHA